MNKSQLPVPASARRPLVVLRPSLEWLEHRIAPAGIVIELSNLGATDGSKIFGEAQYDRIGYSVSEAGDVNGDGIEDLLLGSNFEMPNGKDSGASYVLFGKTTGFSSVLEITDLDGTNGFQIRGEGQYSAYSAYVVSPAGDINGDGLDDLILGTPAFGQAPGTSYVIFGRTAGFGSVLELSELNGPNGFQIKGESATDYAGRSVSAAGDVNGDGIDDIIIGAPGVGSFGKSPGASYVVFGKTTGFGPVLLLSALDGNNGFQINGIGLSDSSGRIVSAAGDVNADGIDDFIIGATGAPLFGANFGENYVVFGKTAGFGSVLELSELDGNDGFRIGEIDEQRLSAAAAGDVNGDGIDDLIIGAYGINASYVVYGRTAGFGAVLELSTLDGEDALRINGDISGATVSGVGDLNGDGIDDLIIGDSFDGPYGNSSGTTYVVFGKTAGFGSVLELSNLDGINGFGMNGVAKDLSGESVSGAGDINGDGIDDLVIGAPSVNGARSADGAWPGASYVVFGKTMGFASVLELSALTGTDGFKIKGEGRYFRSAYSLSAAGDINGDGMDDLIIGGVEANPNGAKSGASYVVFGELGGFGSVLHLSKLNGTGGFRIDGEAQDDRAGIAVSAAGDVNGDGIDDLIIGASGADPNGSNSGASYVVFGKTGGFASVLELSNLNGTNGFQINGEFASGSSGNSVSEAGDVNGDGIDDLIIGAFRASPPGFSFSGVSYIVFGKSAGFGSVLELSNLDGTNGFQINGAAGDYVGISVNAAGDINGDGLDDIIIGASNADAPRAYNSGASYVVFGSTAGFGSVLGLSQLNGVHGFRINGEAASDASGVSVSSAGDVNGDGIDDLIIGASGADSNGYNSGASYVVFGRTTGFGSALELSALTATNGFQINGEVARDNAGRSVSGAGDVNGDGIDDIIIGSRNADPNGMSYGASYVLFGRMAGFGSVLELSMLAADEGFKLKGALGSVSAAGDVNGDGIDDFIIGASGANSNGPRSGTSYVIFGKFTLPTVSVGNATLIEGNTGTTKATFTVTLSEAYTETVSVSYTTVAGTATPGIDFTAIIPTLLTFTPGEISKTITVDVLGDLRVEGNETFSVVLSSPTNVEIIGGTGIGTITNDDSLTVSIFDANGAEGNTGPSPLNFTVVLSEAHNLPVTVRFSTENGTATSGDFEHQAGTLITFAPGEINKTVTVNVTGDLVFEGAETLLGKLTSPTNAIISDGQATGTINDDETAPVISISDASAEEGGNVTFTATLTAALDLPVTFSYTTSNGSANDSIDFNGTSLTSVTFAPGETTKVFHIATTSDANFETDETFQITLSNPINASIGDGQATGTIYNDDTAPVISIGDASAVEGNNVTITATLAGATELPVTFSYTTNNGTAEDSIDFNGTVLTTVTFAPGETTKTFQISTMRDSNIEPAEMFHITLSNPVNASIGDGDAIGTITNVTAVNSKDLESRNPIIFTDANGDKVTITLSGPGTGKVFLEGDTADNANVAAIELTGTTSKSSLIVTVKKAGAGDGLTAIGEVVGIGNSALKSFSAKAADLTGEGITFVGIVSSITARNLGTGGMVQVGGTASDKLNLTLGTLSAGTSIHTPGILSSFKAVSVHGTAVTASGLTLAEIGAGDLNANLSIAGPVGTIVVKDGDATGIWTGSNFKSISVKGGDLSANIASAGVIGGITVKGGGILAGLTAASFGTIAVDGGNISGTITATATAETLAKVAAMKSVTVKTGALTGDVAALGAITKVSVSGGALSGDLSASHFGAISVSGGDFAGSLTALTPAAALGKVLALTSLKVSNGDLTGDVRLSGIAGAISVTALKNAGTGGKLTGATIVASELRSLRVSGDVSESLVLAGADLGADFRLSSGDTFGAGKLGVVKIGGNITGAGLTLIGAGFATTDAILNNADDSIIGTGATSEFKSLTVNGTATETTSYFAAGLFKAVKIGGAKVTVSATDERFLTLA